MNSYHIYNLTECWDYKTLLTLDKNSEATKIFWKFYLMIPQAFKLLLIIFSYWEIINWKKIQYSYQCIAVSPQGSRDDMKDYLIFPTTSVTQIFNQLVSNLHIEVSACASFGMPAYFSLRMMVVLWLQTRSVQLWRGSSGFCPQSCKGASTFYKLVLTNEECQKCSIWE